MQRQFAELLVFQEGHKYVYECAKEAGYEGDNASPRVIASRLQNPKYFPLAGVETTSQGRKPQEMKDEHYESDRTACTADQDG